MTRIQLFCLIELLFIVWGSYFIAEHTPCNKWFDVYIVIGGIAFISWYSLVFYMWVFPK